MMQMNKVILLVYPLLTMICLHHEQATRQQHHHRRFYGGKMANYGVYSIGLQLEATQYKNYVEIAVETVAFALGEYNCTCN